MGTELLAAFGESLPAFWVLCTLADGFPAKLPHFSNLGMWSRNHRVPRGVTGDEACGKVSPDLFLVPELKSLC